MSVLVSFLIIFVVVVVVAVVVLYVLGGCKGGWGEYRTSYRDSTIGNKSCCQNKDGVRILSVGDGSLYCIA